MNWADCPRCKVQSQVLAEKREREMAEAYGKVPVAEYAQLQAETNSSKYEGGTLREDYEIGMGRDGVFLVDYEASCDKCGFEFKYRLRELIPNV